MSSYRPLLDLTSETLIKRTKCYRSLVISVVLIGLGSLISAIVALNPRPLTGLLLLIPAYSYFLICDNSKINYWRRQIMNAWESKSIDLSALNLAITANKILPPATIQGMLETLPNAGDLVIEQSIDKATRSALTKMMRARDTLINYRLFYGFVLSTIVIVSIVTAVLSKSWLPLSVFATIPVLMILLIIMNRKEVRKVKTSVRHDFDLQIIDRDKYNELVRTLNWGGISPGRNNIF